MPRVPASSALDGAGIWRCPVSLRHQHHQLSSSVSRSQSSKRVPQRPKRAIRTAIEEYILDHKSQNHSKKTIEWHILARSMRAFCNWLEAEGYVQVSPDHHVKMPKVGKPLIRIIEFDE